MKIPPTIVILLAVLLSVASAVVVALLKYDDFFREDAEIPAEFTSSNLMRTIPVIPPRRPTQ